MKRWQWTIIATLAVAVVIKLVVFGEISPRQYAVLTASAGKSSEAWRNEVREMLIYANGINELSYHRLLADLPAAEIGTVPVNAPENKREALHNLVQALSFKD